VEFTLQAVLQAMKEYYMMHIVGKNGDSENKISQLFGYIAVILLLLGIYSSVRTVINMLAFEKYPTTSSLPFLGVPFYGPREEDCLTPFLYPQEDVVGSQMMPEENKLAQEKQKEICLRGVMETRETAKVNDISKSLLLLFLGGGILFARKKFHL